MTKVMRHNIADFLNVGTESVPDWALMGLGFTTLDENPTAQVEEDTYVNNRNSSGSIAGYKNVFPFDTKLIMGEDAIDFIFDIAREQKTGSDAETEYCRVELLGGTLDSARPARKFKVAVEVSGMPGPAGGAMRVTGNLRQIGDLVLGTFNVTTPAFTAT